jgi:ribosomal-protein-alanine N-acetyltransferase
MIFSATRHEGFNDGMLWETPQNIEELHPRVIQSKENWIKGVSFQMIITLKETGKSIGMISIREIDENSTWSIGYFMHPEYQSKGYTKEACTEVISFGFSSLDAKTIEAQHAIWNESSGRILQSVGMEFVEYLSEGFQKNGNWIEENKYSITYEQWQNSKV